MKLIHLHHKDIFNSRIDNGEYVLVECDKFPHDLVEISDHILANGAYPLFSIRYDCYSFIKTRKSELAISDGGICVVSSFNNNFTNTFVFEQEKIELDKPIYLTESIRIKDFTKHLDLTGVDYRAMNNEQLLKFLLDIGLDEFEFKTNVVKSISGDESFNRILSACMRPIRNCEYGDEYKTRLAHELRTYKRYGLIGMLNDVYVYSRSWDNLLLRGSANNSLVLFLLGISRIDPVRFDLPFERFINGYKMFEESFDGFE